MKSFRAKPVGWRNESYRHALAARGYSAKKQRRYTALQDSDVDPVVDNMWWIKKDSPEYKGSFWDVLSKSEVSEEPKVYAKKKDSDFIHIGGDTFFKSEDGTLVNVNNPEDMRKYDESFGNEMSVLEHAGIVPWEAAGAVQGYAATPRSLYAKKKARVGVLAKTHNIPIKAEKVEEGRIYPLTPSEVKKIIDRMPDEDVKGIKEIKFVNPEGEQKQAYAQYIRSTKTVKIFSQPYDGTRIDGEDPRLLKRHLKEYVVPHEIGHHKALRTGKTDRSLVLAEKRADANVVGLDPYDRDVRKLVRQGGA